MRTGLRDKVVLVTGASSGIGRATAVEYGTEGARVAVTYYTRQDAARETARLVAEAGGTPLAVRLGSAANGNTNGETLRVTGGA